MYGHIFLFFGSFKHTSDGVPINVLSRSHFTMDFMLTCAIPMTYNNEGQIYSSGWPRECVHFHTPKRGFVFKVPFFG